MGAGKQWGGRIADARAGYGPAELSGSFFHLAAEAIVVTDRDGRMVEANSAFADAAGSGEKDLIGRLFQSVLHPDDRVVLDEVSRQLSPGHPPRRHLLLRIRAADGHYHPWQWNAGTTGAAAVLWCGLPVGVASRPDNVLLPAGAEQSYWVWDAAAGTFFGSDALFDALGCDGTGGLSHDEFAERLHSDDRARWLTEFERALSDPGCRTLAVECRCRDRTDRERVLRLEGRIHRDQAGRVQLVTGAASDVAALWEAATWIRRAEDLTDAIFDNTGAVIVLLDAEGKVLRFNRAAEKLSGYRLVEVKGRPVWETLIPHDKAGEIRAVMEDFVNGRLWYRDAHGYWITRDGEERLIAWSERVVRNDAGEMEYVVCTGVDITGIQQVRGELEETESRYQHLVETAFDMVLIQTGSRIAYINAAGAALLGAESAEQLVGKPVETLFPQRYREVALDRIRAAVEEKRPVPLMEMQVLRLDGSVVDVEVAGVPITYEGRPATKSVYRDITERKRAEAALRAREHYFETLAKVAPVGIFQSDAGGFCRYVNQRWTDITGIDAEHALGEGWISGICSEHREEVATAWYRTVAEKRPFSGEYRFRDGQGEDVWVAVHATPERDSDGDVLGYVGAITDITHSRRNAEELQKYKVELERRVEERTNELSAVNRELEAFSYSVSHDLRAPLRAINGFSAALREDYDKALDETGRYYLQRIESNSIHMADLIDNLLELSRVSRYDMRRERVDLGRFAKNALASFQAADSGREVAARIEDGLETEGDPKLLQLVIQNLVGNAWKYTSRKPHASIVVGACEMEGRRVFFVRDNGVGFDMARADNLFGAFQRLHSRDEFEGTGVGLATVKRIIHRHGGRIWADSEPDKGATFYFTLQDDEQDSSPEQLSLLGER